jgi:hypothetical protein
MLPKWRAVNCISVNNASAKKESPACPGFFVSGVCCVDDYQAIKKPDMRPALLVCTPTEIIQRLFSREA